MTTHTEPANARSEVEGFALEDFYAAKVGLRSDFCDVLGSALLSLGRIDPTYMVWLRRNVRTLVFAPSLRPNRVEEERRLVFGQHWRGWFERSREASQTLSVCVLSYYACLLERRRRLKGDLRRWQVRPFKTALERACEIRFRAAQHDDTTTEAMMVEWGGLIDGEAGWFGERRLLLKEAAYVLRATLRR